MPVFAGDNVMLYLKMPTEDGFEWEPLERQLGLIFDDRVDGLSLSVEFLLDYEEPTQQSLLDAYTEQEYIEVCFVEPASVRGGEDDLLTASRVRPGAVRYKYPFDDVAVCEVLASGQRIERHTFPPGEAPVKSPYSREVLTK